MARYRIVVRKSVSKDLKGIPKNDVRRILARIKSLADDPRPPGTKKLSGRERYRLRQGSCCCFSWALVFGHFSLQEVSFRGS
jgi:mRNA interferase RelE/StbE